MRKRRVFVVLLAWPFLGGCGESKSTERNGPSGAYAQFGRDYAAVFCEELAKCCGTDFSPSRCDAYIGTSFRLNAAVADEDLFEFHPENAERCLADLRTLGVCGSRLPSSCDEVTSGTRVGKESCNTSAECTTTPVSPGQCFGDDEGNSTCAAPARLVGEGDACMETCFAPYCYGAGAGIESQCDGNGGFYCNVDGVCERQRRVGEPCLASTPCTSDAFCDGDVCVTRGGVGAVCEDSTECAPENYCTAGGACTGRVPLGSPCDPNGPGQCLDSSCSSEGVCGNFAVELLCSAAAG